MKVNLSYTVDLEEVLDNTRFLFLKIEEDYREKEAYLVQILRDDYTDENIGKVASAITEYKKILVSLEEKLGELSNILVGYYQFKHTPATSANTQAQPSEGDFDILEGVEEE